MNRKQMLRFLLLNSDTVGGTLKGVPPLTYKAKKAGFLTNYRIYGQTVDGESVGDRTGNLFDKNSPEIQNGVYVDDSGTFINSAYHQLSPYITCIANYTYRLYMERAIRSNAFGVYVNLWDSNKQFIKNIYVAQLPSEYQTLSIRFIPSENGFITFNFLNNADITKNVMFYKSSTALPYEPYGYKVPVTVSNGTDTLTTPIYLPEQIRKVGDEAEYIDYGEQKQHRVRKNLFDFDAFVSSITEVTSGTMSVQGQSITLTARRIDCYTYPYLGNQSGVYKIPVLPNAKYVLSWEADNNKNGRIYVFLNGSLSGSQTALQTEKSIKFATQDDTTYVTIRFGVYSAGDSITYSNIQLNKGSTVLPYEPYIENTEVDVTLPALPTVTGTNVLSVGTEVQPSMVEVMGRIKAVPTN